MPRKNSRWVTFQPSEEERLILEEYCAQEDRTMTDVLRQLVKGLKSKLKMKKNSK